MIDETSAIHPAVKEFLEARELKARYKGEAIAKRHGISRARLYQLVDDFEKENGPALTNSNGTALQPLSETIGAHAVPMVPEAEPGQQAAVESAATQS